MKKTRLFSLLSVLLIVVLLFSACAKKPTGGDQGNNSDGKELEHYEFTHYYNYDWWSPKEWGADEVSKALGEKFNVTVKFAKPDADPKAKLQAMIVSGELPDSIMMDRGTDNIELARLGKLQPLEQYMKNNPNYEQNILETTREQLKIDGKVYGIPNWSRKAASGGNFAWIYNDRIYTDAGRPKLETLDDLYNYAMKVKNDIPKNREGLSVTPVMFPEDNAAGGWNMARGMYRSYGGVINGWFTAIDGTYQLVFRDPAFKQASMELNRWWRDGLFAETMFTDSADQTLEKLVAGRTGLMWYDNSSDETNKYRTILKETFPDDSYEMVSPFPFPPAKGLTKDDIYADFQGTIGWNVTCITTSAKNPQRIFDLFSYYLTKEGAILQMYGPQGDLWDEKDADGLPILKKAESELTADEINRLGLWFWMEPGQSDNVDTTKFAVNAKLPKEKQNWIINNQANILTPIMWLTDEFVNIGDDIDPQSDMGISRTTVDDFIKATYPKVIMAKTAAEAEQLYQSIIDFADSNGHKAVEEAMDKTYKENVKKYGTGLTK